MEPSSNTNNTRSDRVRVSSRRRLAQLCKATAPFAIWGLAVVAAVGLYKQLGTGGTLKGYVETQPVTLSHFEPVVVRDVRVQLYEQVSCGQVVMLLDDRDEQASLAVVEKDLERLSAQVEAERIRLTADNARAQADVEDLARRFAIDREAAGIEYLSALAGDAYNKMLLRGADFEKNLVADLRNRRSATARELNDADTDADSLRAQIEKTEKTLQQLKENYEQADRRWFDYIDKHNVIADAESVLTPLRLAVDVRRRELMEIVQRIDACVLRAPIDGQVTSLAARPGDMIQANTVLASITPPTSDRVVAYLPESMIHTAEIGMSASVTAMTNIGPNRQAYRGVVAGLSAAVDEAPMRYRDVPTYPTWGRGIVIALQEPAELTPGEAVLIALGK